MNEFQQVFTVFFAIFWGATFNVQPKWKPFPYPVLAHIPQAWRRLALSVLFLNLAPIAFYGWTLWVLRGAATDSASWTPSTVLALLAGGVVPAFANFGFYRLWVGLIESMPTWFYRQTDKEQPSIPIEAEPTVTSLKLEYATPWTRGLHFAFAFLYLLVAFTSPLLF